MRPRCWVSVAPFATTHAAPSLSRQPLPPPRLPPPTRQPQGVLRFEGTVLKPDDTPLSALDAADLIEEEDEEAGAGEGLPTVQLDLFVPPSAAK